MYVFAVTARLRWPTCSPICAHGTPPRCRREILRCRRSCGESAGTPAAVTGSRDSSSQAIGGDAHETRPVGMRSSLGTSASGARAILPGGSVLSLSSTALGSLSVYKSDQRWGTAIQATATHRGSWPEEDALTKCLLRFQAVHGFAFVTSESFYSLS